MFAWSRTSWMVIRGICGISSTNERRLTVLVQCMVVGGAENRGMEANKRTHVVFKRISADMIAYAHSFEGHFCSSLFLRCSLDDSGNHLHQGDLTHHGRQRLGPSWSFSWCFWISFSWISTSHHLTCLSFTFHRRTIVPTTSSERSNRRP